VRRRTYRKIFLLRLGGNAVGLQADGAAGDPVAQYTLGDTYCCHGGGPMNKEDWRAARCG
jgi:hypothetical protein